MVLNWDVVGEINERTVNVAGGAIICTATYSAQVKSFTDVSSTATEVVGLL